MPESPSAVVPIREGVESSSEAKPEFQNALSRGLRSSRLEGEGEFGVSAFGQIRRLFGQYQPLGYMLPWQVLDYVELLATYNPDYSQAVENMKMLANSGHTLVVSGKSKLATKRLKSRLEEKSRTIQSRSGGMDGVISKLMHQAATYGAMAGEWVINEEMTDVLDFVDLNPKHIRFFWEEAEQDFMPYQKVSGAQAKEALANGQKVIGDCIKLNPVTFHYYDFDAAPESPYGTPPFLAALANIAIQRDMIANLSQIVKKIGLLGIIDLQIERLQKKPSESDGEYHTRAVAHLEAYAKVAQDMVDDGGLVHFDDVTATTTQIGGNAAGATNIHKMNEEQIMSGLKSMPSLQGRSYCVVPETKVLTADLRWVEAGSLLLGDELVGFDEHLGKGQGSGSCAKMRSSFVEVNKRIRLECVRVTTDKGEIVVSKQHPLVAKHRSQTERVWRDAADLRPGDDLVWFGETWETDNTYGGGYLAGIFDGEGSLGYSGSGKNGTVTMAQLPGQVLDETIMFLKERGFELTTHIGKRVRSTSQRKKNGKFKKLDAVSHLRIVGGKRETLRFLGSVRPLRLLSKARQTWEGAALRFGATANQIGRKDVYATVVSVEDVGVKEVVALQTSTRTFIAEGLLNHNSTTETYAGVAYDITLRNTRKYQRAAKRMVEAGYWLMATMWGENPDSIKIIFNENRSLNRLQEAQAERTEIVNSILKWLIGIFDQNDVAQALGESEPKTDMDQPPDNVLGTVGNVVGLLSKDGSESDSQDQPAPATRMEQIDDDDPEGIEGLERRELAESGATGS